MINVLLLEEFDVCLPSSRFYEDLFSLGSYSSSSYLNGEGVCKFSDYAEVSKSAFPFKRETSWSSENLREL
jgi:hypothetical protein